MSENTITITGNAVRDPELRFTTAGSAGCNFGVAVNRVWTDNAGTKQEQVSFFNVQVWSQMAENVAETVRKGDRVTVHGRMEQRSWETPEGEKRTVWDLVANDVAMSLRFATGAMNRNERQSSDRQQAPQQQRATRPAPARQASANNYDDFDSDPF